MIKNLFEFLYKILGLPYYAFLNLLKGLYAGAKQLYKGAIASVKMLWKYLVKFIKSIPAIFKFIGKLGHSQPPLYPKQNYQVLSHQKYLP